MDAVQNSTTVFNRGWVQFFNRSTATIAVETGVLLLIGLFAIGGNLLVFISIYRNPSLRTITNYFVLSLAMTDILYPLMAFPLTIIASVKNRFDLGQKNCDFQALSIISLIHITVITMALMAVNRFVRVCKPLFYSHLFNKKTSIIVISIVWVSIFTGTALYCKVGNSITEAVFIPDEIRCNFIYDPNKKLFVVLGNLMILVCFVIPFTVITYCYYKVFKKIKEHKRNVVPTINQRGLGTNANVREIKITWILVAVLFGYCMTWVPVLIVTLMTNTLGWGSMPRQVRMIVTIFGSSSCAINPVIYGLMNPNFRLEYAKIFGCKKVTIDLACAVQAERGTGEGRRDHVPQAIPHPIVPSAGNPSVVKLNGNEKHIKPDEIS